MLTKPLPLVRLSRHSQVQRRKCRARLLGLGLHHRQRAYPPRIGSVPLSGVAPAAPPPLRHFAHHGRAQHHGATIMRSRLAGSYCVAESTTPARKPRALALSRWAAAAPALPTSTLSGLACGARRLHRRPKSRPTASSATSQHQSGALRARGTNAGLG